MLFNTLAYAKFFALVFVISWALVRRRNALFLPWFALAGYLVFQPLTITTVAVCFVSFMLTAALTRRVSVRGPTATEAVEPDQVPPLLAAAVSLVINLCGLAFFTIAYKGRDPASLALTAFGIELPQENWVTIVGLVVMAVGGLTLLRARKVRLIFILLASYVFYAHWDWRFLPLIFASSTIDWFLGNAIHRAGDSKGKKYWLIVTACVNLGVLAIFKYYNFGYDTAREVSAALGWNIPEATLRIALPVGISFFTFESMSYVIDVYRGDIKPQKSYLEYLSFVAFFPHLVAGPIVRPRDLLPQLANPARWSSKEASEGLFLIAIGLLKKVTIGDYLALNLVDRVFDMPTQYSALECYSAVLGYALQIYCDFSGYTDIAIGSALLLGVRFPLNFNSPYKAHDIQDFWRRWHISLSTWLRDYLYIPLGGNRHGEVRTYVNLLLTMLLGGLWHGAAWTFVVWGGLHGSALAVNRYWSRSLVQPKREEESKQKEQGTPYREQAAAPSASILASDEGASQLGTAGGTLLALHLGAGALILFEIGGSVTYLVWAGLFLVTLVTYLINRGAHRARAPAEAARDQARTARGELHPVVYWLRVALTFHFVCVCWVFFRAENFQKAWIFFSQIGSLTLHGPNLHLEVVGTLAAGLIYHFAPDDWYRGAQRWFCNMPAPVQGLVLFVVALLLRERASADAVPFVYFQF